MNKLLAIKILKTAALLCCLLLVHTPWLGNIANEYTEQSFKRALVTYAVSRSLNGVISVAQGTEVAISPVGVGLTFAPGQILDPVNDLIERFSWIVLASGTSLGIQHLLLGITTTPLVSWFLTLITLVVIVFAWFYRPVSEDKTDWSGLFHKLLVIVLLIRFSVPVIAVVNEFIYQQFLQADYQVAQNKLQAATTQIENINQTTSNSYQDGTDDAGLLEKASQWLNSAQHKLDIDKQIASLKQSADDVSHQVINMFVIFLTHTIIFPLLFLWLCIRLAKYGANQFRV